MMTDRYRDLVQQKYDARLEQDRAMTDDFKHIEETINFLRTATDQHYANTMQDMLDVARAAENQRAVDPRFVSVELETALDKLKAGWCRE